MIFCASEFLPSISETLAKKIKAQGSHVAVSAIATVPLVHEKKVRNKDPLFGIKSEEVAEPSEQLLLQPLMQKASKAIDYNDPAFLGTLHSDETFTRNSTSLKFLLTGSDVFPASYEEAGRTFMNYLHFQESARMALLRTRDLKPHLFSVPLPFFESDILQSSLYRNILIGKTGLGPLEDGSSVTEMVSHRDPRSVLHTQLGRKEFAEDEEEAVEGVAVEQKNDKLFDFLRRVRDAHTAVNRRARKAVYTTASVVQETDYLPPPAEEGEVNLLPPRKRALKPPTATRTPMAVSVTNVDVLIQIMGAKNVPQRNIMSENAVARRGSMMEKTTRQMQLDRDNNEATVAGPDEGGALSYEEDAVMDPLMLADDVLLSRNGVRSFVEVRFQAEKVSTTALEGMAPIWRQSYSLPFKAPQLDYSAAALVQVRDNIVLTVFDEVVEDDAHRGGFLEGETTSRTEKRYLGDLSIPISTLVNEGRIEATFRLTSPLANFGYSLRSQTNKRQQQKATNMFVNGDGAGETTQDHVVRKSAWVAFIPTLLGGLFNAPSSVVEGIFDYNEYLSSSITKEFGYFASSSSSTFISVMLTLDPLLPPNASHFLRPTDKLPPASLIVRSPGEVGNEAALLSHAKKWLADLMNYSPHTKTRNYALFATNNIGHAVFIPRFLTESTELPPGFNSRRSIVHLVASIPYISDAAMFLGASDLWCTMKQTFEIGAGDEEEHAVLMYNFLAALRGSSSSSNTYPSEESLKKESLFLVMGSGLPEGDTMYILLRDSSKPAQDFAPSNYVLVNPCTGFIYSAADPHCPLKHIYTLVTAYNIFANIQNFGDPSRLEFDITNSLHWRPFFGGRFPFPPTGIGCIQYANVLREEGSMYKSTLSSYCIEVETVVRNSVKSQMRKWRSKRKRFVSNFQYLFMANFSSRSITTYHPDASSTMYDMLQQLETWKRNGRILLIYCYVVRMNCNILLGDVSPTEGVDSIESVVSVKLKSLLRTRAIKGYPINIPFTDVNDVIARVTTLYTLRIIVYQTV